VTVSPARRIAAEVLLRVEQGGAFANLALDGALRAAGALEPREAALATELTYGTLRWQLQLDRAIAVHSERPSEELDANVRAALRLSAFELLHHPRVPARVARRKTTRDEVRRALREERIVSTPGEYSPDALVLAPGAPPALDIEGHEQGLFQSQDEAAQLVSLYAAPPRGASVLDACAAPGGKACHLAELGAAEVLAVDLHARKAKQIEEAAHRLGLDNVRFAWPPLGISVEHWDAVATRRAARIIQRDEVIGWPDVCLGR